MAVDVRAYSLVSSLASAVVRFTGLSTLYSYWGDAGDVPTATYYLRVGGMRVVCGTDVITIGAP